jgi:hypothetical protein
MIDTPKCYHPCFWSNVNILWCVSTVKILLQLLFSCTVYCISFVLDSKGIILINIPKECVISIRITYSCSYKIFLPTDIYQEAGLPLWLRPYEVIVTSAFTALIETIPDTVIMFVTKLVL